MGRATPNGTAVFAVAGFAVVLCGGLVVMMEYAKTEIKIKKKESAVHAAAGPAGPFAAKIKALTFDAAMVTQQAQDEADFFGQYVRTTEPGLYLDIVSDEVLFTSVDKLETRFGFAEFSKPFDPARLVSAPATVHGDAVTQVRSKLANSYLGTLRPDDTGTERYVINSAALRFVPLAELDKAGLGQHRALLAEKPKEPPPPEEE